MSTRSNTLVINPDGTIQQYYVHCDGYFSGVGEHIRKNIVYSIGLSSLNKNYSVYDDFSTIMKIESYDPETDKDCGQFFEKEYLLNKEDNNRIHIDIEYLYIVDFSDENYPKLYARKCYGRYNKQQTVSEIINDVCTEEFYVNLEKQLR